MVDFPWKIELKVELDSNYMENEKIRLNQVVAWKLVPCKIM